MDIKIANIASR
jgi:hypothetical protein